MRAIEEALQSNVRHAVIVCRGFGELVIDGLFFMSCFFEVQDLETYSGTLYIVTEHPAFELGPKRHVATGNCHLVECTQLRDSGATAHYDEYCE